jgi:hypothetical protein
MARGGAECCSRQMTGSPAAGKDEERTRHLADKKRRRWGKNGQTMIDGCKENAIVYRTSRQTLNGGDSPETLEMVGKAHRRICQSWPAATRQEGRKF